MYLLGQFFSPSWLSFIIVGFMNSIDSSMDSRGGFFRIQEHLLASCYQLQVSYGVKATSHSYARFIMFFCYRIRYGLTHSKTFEVDFLVVKTCKFSLVSVGGNVKGLSASQDQHHMQPKKFTRNYTKIYLPSYADNRQGFYLPDM